jgi:uncharacterized protein (TIGR04255 family)
MTDQTQPYTRSSGLPFFEHPPVTQVDMGLQLQALKLRAVHLGPLHSRFEEYYPVIEEHPPLPMQIEQFQDNSPSGVRFQFQLLDRPPLPMLVFLAEDRSSLVQVDSSRFFCAWRRSNDNATYPRYENFRAEFVRNAEIFDRFTADINEEAKVITQAEISYINDIPIEGGLRPDILLQRLPSLSEQGSINAEEISSISIAQHFTYKTKEGVDFARLHISAEPISAESETMLRLSLVYRGEPRERFADVDGLTAAMRFLDEGHDRIVRAFAENTTPEAHRMWGRVM